MTRRRKHSEEEKTRLGEKNATRKKHGKMAIGIIRANVRIPRYR